MPATSTTPEIQGPMTLMIEDLGSRDRLVDGAPLEPPEKSITVRIREGANPTTSAPAVGNEDVLTDDYVIECPGIAEAVGAAARAPGAATSNVAVHPPLDQVPVSMPHRRPIRR